MSLNKIIVSLVILCLVSGCNKKPRTENFETVQKHNIELAKAYHEQSNYFLQPSGLYRRYKDSALMVMPKNTDYRQRLSYSYKKVGDHIKAMQVLNKAVEIDMANGKPDVLQYRAWTLLYYYRDYEGVISDVDLIEKITGNSYNVCWGEPCGFHKGQALYKLDNYRDAIETFEKVNEEEEKQGFDSDDNYMIFYYMARCYTELEDYDSAVKYYNKAIASVEQLPEAYYQLSLIYRKQNEFEKANKNTELVKKYMHYGLSEPYVERFDEFFPYMIDGLTKN